MGTISTASFQFNRNPTAGTTLKNANMVDPYKARSALYLHQSHIPKFQKFALSMGWSDQPVADNNHLRMRHPHYKEDLVVSAEVEDKKHLVLGMSTSIYKKFLAKLKNKFL